VALVNGTFVRRFLPAASRSAPNSLSPTGRRDLHHRRRDRGRAAEAAKNADAYRQGLSAGAAPGASDKEALARQKAVFALGQIGPDAEVAVPALIRLLRDEDEGVRSAVPGNLLRIGTPAMPALIKRARAGERENPGKPCGAGASIPSLAANGAPRAGENGADEEPATRQQALKTLGEMRAAELVAVTAWPRPSKIPSSRCGWPPSKHSPGELERAIRGAGADRLPER